MALPGAEFHVCPMSSTLTLDAQCAYARAVEQFGEDVIGAKADIAYA
jgi:hypothetical protein